MRARSSIPAGIIAALCLALFSPLPAWAGESVFQKTERAATVADPWHEKFNPLWRRVLLAQAANPGFTPGGENFGPVDRPTWKNMIAQARRSPEQEVLRMVNGYFNQWRPQNDQVAWGSPEYWTSPMEFIRKRGGDCEDYAIAKYFALRFLGLPAERMRIVAVRRLDETGKPAPEMHAVLAVHTGATWFILDNNARPKNNIFPHTQYKGRFDPVYSVNEGGAWVHGNAASDAPERDAPFALPQYRNETRGPAGFVPADFFP
jgi:predicted transglutaminase-like cysteine proteinase